MIIITKSVYETEKAGMDFAKNLTSGEIVVLTGNLGAGKTTFVQGIAKALLVKSRVISPTFMLVRKHRGKKDGEKINLYHLDLYRLNMKDLSSLGLEEIFEDEKGIFVFEWGEKHESLKADWEVEFRIMDDMREIKIKNLKDE